MAKGEQSSTTTTQVNLSPEQRELLNIAMPGVRQFAANVPQRYPGSTIAPFTPEQTVGQDLALGAAGNQQDLANNAAGATNFLTSGNIWDPAANPNLRGAISAATRPISENLTESALPAIRGEAVATGNFGGSRQGIAEGLATREASRAIGDTASKVAQGQYETNIGAQLKALGLTPTTQAAQLSPATTVSGVGDVRQALQQALLGEKVGNFNYAQLAPFLQSQEIIGLLNGLPGGSTTATGTGPKPNALLGALGGAATGASLGSAIMPGAGTGIGAGMGALLSFLSR